MVNRSPSMQIFAVLLPIMVTAGCQSDASVRSSPPLDKYQSSKSADAAVTCLIPSLTAHYRAISPQRFVAQTIAPGSEYDIVPTDGFVNGHFTFTVNVKAAPGGATVSIYKGQAMLPSITNSIRSGVRSCL